MWVAYLKLGLLEINIDDKAGSKNSDDSKTATDKKNISKIWVRLFNQKLNQNTKYQFCNSFYYII